MTDDAPRPRMTPRQYFDAALRDEWDGLERIHRDLRLADLFTLLNALMGLSALLITARYSASDFGGTTGIGVAIALVLVGVILDGVDGAVARMGKGNGPLGGVLDTLADTLTFVTTSTVVAFVALRSQPGFDGWDSLALVALPLAFYALCGLLRLARFESLRDDGKSRGYFSGMPTPAAAVTLLSVVLVGGYAAAGGQPPTIPAWVLPVAALYLGILMVSRIRFPKLRGWLAAGSVAILVAVLATVRMPAVQRAIAWALLAFMALYVLAGPFYVLARYGANPGK